MESNGNRRAKDERSDDPTKSKENTPTGAATATVSTTSPATLAAKTANTSETPQKSPRKRRKVNHGMLYSFTNCCSVNKSCHDPSTHSPALANPPPPPPPRAYIHPYTRSPCTSMSYTSANHWGLRAFL